MTSRTTPRFRFRFDEWWAFSGRHIRWPRTLFLLGVLVLVSAVAVQLTRSVPPDSVPPVTFADWLFEFFSDWSVTLAAGITLLMVIATFLILRDASDARHREWTRDGMRRIGEWVIRLNECLESEDNSTVTMDGVRHFHVSPEAARILRAEATPLAAVAIPTNVALSQLMRKARDILSMAEKRGDARKLQESLEHLYNVLVPAIRSSALWSE